MIIVKIFLFIFLCLLILGLLGVIVDIFNAFLTELSFTRIVTVLKEFSIIVIPFYVIWSFNDYLGIGFLIGMFIVDYFILEKRREKCHTSN